MPKITLSWNEMRDRAFAFVREWKDETSEKSEAQSFWTEWFNIFGLKRRGTIASGRVARGSLRPTGDAARPAQGARPARRGH